ncbi:MAG: RNA 2',3'-cyclic phosphodiesterase [Candidatus Micrarchaeota archaeon]
MRLFIAVEIPEDLREKIVLLQNDIPREGLKLVEKENLHITLAFLGEVDERKKDELVRALGEIKSEKFAMKLGGMGAFPSENYIRVVWVGVEGEGLKKLHARINEALRALHFKTESYSPHLTLARVKEKPSTGLRERVARNKNVSLGECEVREFLLKKSTLTPKGPIYENVAAFELV